MIKLKKDKFIIRIGMIICILLAIVFAIRNIIQPDIWWLLTSGEWIVKHGRIPVKDVFSFTFFGKPWMNVKWLFEVLIYFISKIGGPEFLMILQAIVNVVIIYVLFKISLLIKIACGKTEHIKEWFPGFTISIIIAIIGWNYRMIGRPEMMSHLFTLLFIFIFLKYRIKPGKFIFWLIPLQILWANLHDGFVNGMVICSVMAVSAIFDHYIYHPKILKSKQVFPVQIVLVSVLSILSVIVSPYGFKMLAYPFDIYSQLNDNKYTAELLSFTTKFYWFNKEAYIFIFLFIISLIAFFKRNLNEKTGSNIFIRPLQTYGTGFIVMYFLFFYLGLTAYRNIVFFILISSPVIAVWIDSILDKCKQIRILNKIRLYAVINSVFIIAGILLYISVCTDFYYRHTEKYYNYGLKINAEYTPGGVVDYIKTHHITGRCFSDYKSSSYLLWSLRPDFKTFIDMRDFDVFNRLFFKNYKYLEEYAPYFNEIDSIYQFDYVVINSHELQNLADFIAKNQKWEALYADPTTVLFQKVSGKKDMTQINIRNAHDTIDFFYPIYTIGGSNQTNLLTKIFWPFYKSIDTLNNDLDYSAARFYKTIGYFELSIRRISKFISSYPQNYLGYQVYGFACLGMGDMSDSVNNKKFYNKAENAFKIALGIDNKQSVLYKGLAHCEIRKGNLNKANELLLTTVRLNDQDITAFLLLADNQFSMYQMNPGKKDFYMGKWLEYMKDALALDPANLAIKFKIGVVYSERNDCESARLYLNGLSAFPGMSKNDNDMLVYHKRKCNIP
jgi:hypothetical protein